MPEEEAFCVFVKLMQDYRLRELFKPSMAELGLCMYQFECMIQVNVRFTFLPLSQCDLSKFCVRIIEASAGERDGSVVKSTFAALVENLDRLLAPTWWLPTVCNSCSRGFGAAF